MGSLSNLYISQSYQSLIHLGNDSTASTSLVELQDGFGNGIGISVNTIGDLKLDGTLSVQNLTVTGAVAIDTYFTSSTPAYTNSTQPYFTDTVFVTGSYTTGSFPPSIADVKVGWVGNGINVTNGLVTAVSQSVSGYYITMAGQFPQISQQYTFTGGISAPVTIDGDLIISENLIVSGTFDIEGKLTINDNVRINGDLEVSGSQRNTGSLFVSNAISSSTITGIGNVSAYSSSVWAEFTNIENYTSSLRAAFTASGVDTIFTNNITASNIEVRNNLNVVGTITANKIITLIESSSIIYSSGSNILGDEVSDTQTLIGSVIMSGSASLTGSMGISNDLNVIGNISSSTISGIGNVTTYSQSVDARLDIVEATASLYVPFSQSVEQQLTSLENFTSSTFVNFSQSVDSRLDFLEGPFSTSVDLRLDELENWSSSLETNFVTEVQLTQTASFLQNQINQKLFTSSFNAYTQSYSQSVAVTTTGLDNRINTLSSFTASYATTGSNVFRGNQTITGSVNISGSTTFVGNQIITGSLILSSSAATELEVIGNSIFSGSVRGRVSALTINGGNTASMDLSLANFFTITLNTAGAVRIEPTNIQPGETVTLRLKQPAGGFSSVNFPSNVDYPNGFQYNATPSANAVDIITFLSFDTGSLYYSRANQFV